jgi:hypothetical protein
MSTHRDEFTTFDIIKALGIPRERLQDWINRGFIKPTIPAEGKGTKAIFTRDDIYRIELFQKLIGMGLNRKTASCVQRVRWLFRPLKNTSTDCLRMIIKFFTKEGKLVPEFEPYIASENTRMSLKTGQLFKLGDGADLDWQRECEEWESIIIINLDRIIQKVDMLLSGLE